MNHDDLPQKDELGKLEEKLRQEDPLSLAAYQIGWWLSGVFSPKSTDDVAKARLTMHIAETLLSFYPRPKRYTRLFRSQKRPQPPLRSLVRFADFFGLDTRKKIKAMAGDYDVEIRRLRRERRYRTAKWNSILAWGYALWFALWTPLERITTTVVKMLKGS